MKTLFAFVLTGLLTLVSAPQLSAAPQFGGRQRNQDRDQVCVYQDIQYQGREQCYAPGDVANLGSLNNAISSIRVYGRARVTAYEDTNFRGRSIDFTSDVNDLGQRGLNGSRSWSDHIQSLRVTSDGDYRTNGNYPPTSGNYPPTNGNY